MKRYLLFIAALIAALAVLVPPATAQDPAATLSYGQTFTGTITNREFEVLYTFEGKANDTILATMEATEDNTLYTPALILLDSEADVLADQSNWGRALLVYTLPADGTYTLVATRQGGRGGDAEGGYQIRLLLPQILVAGSSVTSTVSDPALADFYVLDAQATTRVSFERTSGIYAPLIRVSQFSTEFEGSVDEWGTLDLPILLGGSFVLPAEPPTRYLIEVAVAPRLLWNSSLSTETSYALQVE